MNEKRVTPKKRSRVIPILGLVILLLAGFVTGGVYARYVQARNATGTVVARDFYFTSDYLTENGKEYIINTGTRSVTFELRNFADTLRYTEEPIYYTVSLVSEDSDSVISPAEGSISGKGGKASVTVSNMSDGGVYTVTAFASTDPSGVGGYQKTMSATFAVRAAKGGVYMNVNDENDYFTLLTVWAEDIAGDAVISAPAGLLPDNTDPAMSGWTGTSGTDDDSFTNVYSSHTYRFFKKTVGSDYEASDFTVKVGGTAAVEAAIEDRI